MTTKLFWDYSDSLSPIFTLILTILSRKKIAVFYRKLLTYLILTTICMALTNILADRKINNMFVYHIYSCIEVIFILPLLGCFEKVSAKIYISIVAIFLAFSIINITFFERLKVFNSNSSSLAALFIASSCFKYYFELIKKNEILYFQYLPSFWIVSGFLFYSIVSILILASYKYKEWFIGSGTHYAWQMEEVANVIKFLMISIGIVCSYRRVYRPGSW